MIGDRQRRHLMVLGQFDHRVKPTGAIEERVLRVGMQMYKRGEFHGISNNAQEDDWVKGRGKIVRND
jgi:hypothetical protein